jgi:multiple sugar transport system substrate-binding protein
MRRALTLLPVLFLLCACTRSPGEPQTLSLWVMGREGEVAAQLLPEFERQNPGIRVRLQQIPWSAAPEKRLTAFAGDALPGLCQLGNTWVPELVALDPRAAASTLVAASDYFPGIWDTSVIGGHLYGIPWYVDTRRIFYRSDLLRSAGVDAPPRAWTESEHALAAIKRSATEDEHGILLPLSEFEPLLALALQQPESLLRDDDTRGAFASPGFRRTLGFYSDMFRTGWAPSLGTAQIANVWMEFGRGRFAFYISGPWNIGELKRRLPPERQGDWMTAALPGPDGPGASTAGDPVS